MNSNFSKESYSDSGPQRFERAFDLYSLATESRGVLGTLEWEKRIGPDPYQLLRSDAFRSGIPKLQSIAVIKLSSHDIAALNLAAADVERLIISANGKQMGKWKSKMKDKTSPTVFTTKARW